MRHCFIRVNPKNGGPPHVAVEITKKRNGVLVEQPFTCPAPGYSYMAFQIEDEGGVLLDWLVKVPDPIIRVSPDPTIPDVAQAQRSQLLLEQRAASVAAEGHRLAVAVEADRAAKEREEMARQQRELLLQQTQAAATAAANERQIESRKAESERKQIHQQALAANAIAQNERAIESRKAESERKQMLDEQRALAAQVASMAQMMQALMSPAVPPPMPQQLPQSAPSQFFHADPQAQIAALQHELQQMKLSKAHGGTSTTTDAEDEGYATDEGDEDACETSIKYWEKRDKALPQEARATSEYLAPLQNRADFTAEWRRRITPANCDASQLERVNEMMVRLTTAHEVIRQGARTNVGEYLIRKVLRQAFADAALLILSFRRAKAELYHTFKEKYAAAKCANKKKKTAIYTTWDGIIGSALFRAASSPRRTRHEYPGAEPNPRGRGNPPGGRGRGVHPI